jgi:hypothetical protein
VCASKDKHPKYTLVIFCSLLFVFPQIINAQQCPSYTHKTTLIGARDSLPNGWFLYGLSSTNGLYKCDTRSGTPTMVPNTSNDRVIDIDITDDGQWIVYLVQGPSVTVGRRTYTYKNFVYMIRPDGTGRIEVPVVIDSSGFATYPSNVQFYRHSPYGNELAYISGHGRVRCVSYHLDNQNNAILDSTRTIVYYLSNPADSGYEMYANIATDRQFSIFQNQLFIAIYIPPNMQGINPLTIVRTSYVTIPDQGRGISHIEDIYKWLNDDYGTWYGCGLTMSIDGSLCLSNSNAVGGTSGCVPTQTMNPPMDHKGFYVTRFMFDTMPAINRDSVILSPKYGISINWCPTQYRIGTYDELGFTGWSFSNNNDYVIGDQEGNNTPIQGAWVVNVPTNTWTLVYTASNNRVVSPSLYLPGMSSIKREMQSPRHASLTSKPGIRKMQDAPNIMLEPSVYGCEIYSLSGKKVWKYERSGADRRESIAIPGSLRIDNAMIVKWIIKDGKK